MINTSIVLLLMQWAIFNKALPAEANSFIVAELFTSEGCSSCPPADRLLSEIVDAEYEDVEVMALSFHVDYWDYIGWKDPYADARFGDRQRLYAQKLKSYQVYTPQLVVNGKEEFVGSNRSKWQQVLRRMIGQRRDASLHLKEVDIANGVVSAALEGSSGDDLILNFAVVERGLSQQVTRGENRGRRLQHDNVVRYFEQRKFDREVTMKAKLPTDLKLDNAKVIVYLQRAASFEIVAATQQSLL